MSRIQDNVPKFGTTKGSALDSDAFTARTLEYIQKHRRAFWNRLPSRTFWRIDLRNPPTFIFCSNQSLNRFLPLLIKKQKRSVSRSILELEKRYTHANRSEFHQKTIGIVTISVGGPVSGIVRVLRFSPEDLRLTLGSDAFTARTLEYIQKHKRAFWNRLPPRTFWRINLRNPSTFIFCSKIWLSPTCVRLQKATLVALTLETWRMFSQAGLQSYSFPTLHTYYWHLRHSPSSTPPPP